MNEKIARTIGKNLFDACREALFPSSCISCDRLFQIAKRPGNPVEKDTDLASALFRLEMAPYLCPGCIDLFQGIAAPMCTLCGLPFVSGYGPDHVCGACENAPNNYDMARSMGSYATTLRSVIHHYKYRSGTHLASSLGRLLWFTFNVHFEPEHIDMVVPVPLHPRRLRSRGFNQSALLVRQWPVLGLFDDQGFEPFQIAPEMLVRRRATLPQTGLNQAQRAENLQMAFAVPNKAMLNGKRILLVDDVLTTGATANACAGVLKNAGAVRVDVLTLARTV